MQRSISSRLQLFCCLALPVILIFSSCSRKPEVSRYIPKDAAFVVSIDAGRIRSKVNWDSIRNAGFFRDMLAKIPDTASRALLNDPQQSGIDLTSHIYCFFKPDKRFGSGYIGLIAAIKNAGKFEQFVRTIDSSAAVGTDGSLRWAAAGDNIIGWDHHTAILLAGIKKEFTNDDNTSASSDTTEMKALFRLSASDAISSITPFADLQKKPADISVWINIEQFYRNYSFTENPMISVLIKPELYEGYYIAATTDFENGKITTDADVHMNNKLSAVYRNLSGNALNKSLVSHIPSADIAGIFAASFKPVGMKDLFTLLGIDGLLNAWLSQQDLSLDDVLKALKGDIVIAASDLTAANNPTDSSMAIPVNKPKANWLIALTVGDNNAMNKLLDVAVNNKLLMKNGNTYTLAAETGSRTGFVKTDKLLTIASGTDYANQFIAGNSGQASPEIVDILQGKSAGLYMNIHKIMAAFGWGNNANSDARETQHILKDLYMTTDALQGNIQHASVVLRLMDDHQNSLAALLATIARIYDNQQWQGRRNSIVVPDTLSQPH